MADDGWRGIYACKILFAPRGYTLNWLSEIRVSARRVKKHGFSPALIAIQPPAAAIPPAGEIVISRQRIRLAHPARGRRLHFLAKAQARLVLATQTKFV